MEQRNHDVSIRIMLKPADDERIGLTGCDADLQFVRLANAYNELKAERDRLLFEIGLAQEEAATFIGHCHDKTGQIKDLTVKRDRLREVLKNMLKSADCMWEDRDMGHDWPEACQQARAELQEDSDE
jgi:hypothetical protein